MPSDRKIAISGYWRSVAANQSSIASSLRHEGRGLDELEPAARVEAVDLLHVELAHEADGPGVEDLARHHDREPRRVGDHEARRDQVRSTHEPLVDLLAPERDVLTAVLVVRGVEAGPHVALDGGALLAEAVVEAREVWQIRHVFHERLDARSERSALAVGAVGELVVD